MKQQKSLYSYWTPNYWPTWIGLGCLRLVTLLPHSAALAVGRVLGRFTHSIAGKRRAIVRRNIELCLPELDPTERNTLAHEHFMALGMSLIELGMHRWTPDRRLRDLFEYEGLEHVQEPLAAGKGVIVLSAHFTEVEISGRGMRLADVPYDAVYRRNRSDFMTEILRSGRELTADVAIEKRDIKMMVRRLRAGHAVWYAPDQSYKRKGAEVVKFFGIPTMHTTATATLARLGKAVVVPFFPRRTPDGKYVMKFLPAFENFPSGDPVEDVMRYVEVLEDHIRSCPEQYFWIHRKFKDLPEGYEDYYADLDAAK